MRHRVLGLLAGFAAGFVVVLVINGISGLLHPPPEDFDPSDMEQVRAFVASLPPAAFAIVLVAHGLGAFAAGFTCSAVERRGWWGGWLMLGLVFTMAGISNLVQIPHPLWFGVVDVLLYLPAAFGGGLLADRLLPRRTDEPDPPPNVVPEASADDPSGA